MALTNATKNYIARTAAKSEARIQRAKASKIRAEGSKIRQQGKAIRDQVSIGERERTKRSLGRSTALGTTMNNVINEQREANTLNKQQTQLWNSIINGTNSSATENQDTSHNNTDSTTNTDDTSRKN